MDGPPPRFTLFPYTTLFRSSGSVALLSLLGLAQFRLGRYREAITSYTAALEKDPGVDASRDRKSTRLNSSHVGVSYAVFCLKKRRRGRRNRRAPVTRSEQQQ